MNDQSLAADDEGEKYDRVRATRGDGFVSARTYTGWHSTLIPAVADHGSPQLTRYTRVIVDVVE